jgi:lipopolysaccharide/colanic/teichoic acid biosynthesis glycosyltransferase
VYLKIKRILDFCAASVGLIILAPLFLITAAAIKLDSGGAVFFKQERIGFGGKTFRIYKFRSMCEGAEKKGSGVYSYADDPRVSRVGRWLRLSSIDEFPQLLNICKGEMSFIGPRPTLTYHPWTIDEYTPFQRRRFDTRPGISGWAQVNGRKELDWEKRIEFDVEYVENVSFWLDVKIFFLTIKKVFGREANLSIGKTVAAKPFLSAVASETAAQTKTEV